MDEDLWTPDTGIVTDYDGTIIDAFFQLNTESQFGDPQTQLRLKFLTDDEKEVEERYNCGPDWISNDGGVTCVHPTKLKWNQNTQAGKLLVAVVESGAGDTVRAKGSPTVSGTWLGLRFFMEAVTTSGTRRDNGEKWTSTRNYPSKFLGVGEASGEASVPAEYGVLGGFDDATVAKMTLLAKTLTHGEWVDKVMELDGVLASDQLIQALPDADGLYAQLKEK